MNNNIKNRIFIISWIPILFFWLCTTLGLFVYQPFWEFTHAISISYNPIISAGFLLALPLIVYFSLTPIIQIKYKPMHFWISVVALIPGTYVGISLGWLLFLAYFHTIFPFLQYGNGQGWGILIYSSVLPAMAIPHFLVSVYLIKKKFKLVKKTLVIYLTLITPVIVVGSIVSFLFLREYIQVKNHTFEMSIHGHVELPK